MSTKMSLIALAATALAATALASSAMAEGGQITHRTLRTPIPEATEIQLKGWARFEGGIGGIECHVTATAEALGNEGKTGKVTHFDARGNDTDWCTTFGDIEHCHVVENGVEAKNLPYHLTTTSSDVVATASEMAVHANLSGFLCPDIELTMDSPFTLEPLETGSGATGTAGNIDGNTTDPGQLDPIAGVLLIGTGEIHLTSGGTEDVVILGEMEVLGEHFETWVLD